MPSGVDVDGATLPSAYVMADSTITFGTYKNAPARQPGGGAAGWNGTAIAELVDIGLGPHLRHPSLEAIEADDGHLLVDTFAWLSEPTSHKYSRGVVGIAAGSEQYAGAAHLCVAGAQAGHGRHGPLRRLRGAGARVSSTVRPRSSPVAGRVQAWVVGPGGGDDAGRRSRRRSPTACRSSSTPALLQHLPELVRRPRAADPARGELAAMLDTDRDEVEADPLGHATEAGRALERHGAAQGRPHAGRHPGPHDPGQPDRIAVARHRRARAMCLPGSPARCSPPGADPHDAGSLAAFLHGAASVRANRGGPITASDVAAALPGTIAAFHDGMLDDVRDWRD